MKTLLICLAIAALGISHTYAQDGERIFKRFKGDLSAGYAAPIGDGNNGGFIFAMEPKFSVMDQLAIGIKFEGVLMGNFSSNTYYGGTTIDDAKAISATLLTADFYFTKTYTFRPFVGGGAGIFGLASDVYDTYDGSNTDYKFGGMLRAGAEIKHFRFGVEYSFIPSSRLNDYNNVDNGSLKNSYIGIKAGFCFGGGPL